MPGCACSRPLQDHSVLALIPIPAPTSTLILGSSTSGGAVGPLSQEECGAIILPVSHTPMSPTTLDQQREERWRGAKRSS